MSTAMRGRAARGITGLAVALCLVFAARAISDVGGKPAADFFGTYVYIAIMLLAAVVAAIKATTEHGLSRAGWILLALAGLSWTGGNVFYTIAYGNGESSVPVPSLADVMWIQTPFLLAAGILILARKTRRPVRRAARFDAYLSATALAAVSASIVMEPVLEAAAQQEMAGFLTSLFYPISDLVMVGTVLALAIRREWRLPRELGFLAAAMAVQAVGDSIYLLQVAAGTYEVGGLLDLGWLVPSVLLACAALTGDKADEVAVSPAVMERFTPVLLAGGALAIMCREAMDLSPEWLTVATAGLALAVAILRMAVSLADNRVLLAESRHEALTDALTGLGNRRSLVRRLEDWDGEAICLTVFDLDGFKAYNDSFGHAAGDELLKRIGSALSATCATAGGTAYRMGGDEFSAILPPEADIEQLAAQIVMVGEGFRVGASHGSAMLPLETGDPEEALRIADTRMYAQKHGGRASAARQSADVLKALLAERSETLAEHGDDVARLAAATAKQMGLDDLERETIRAAAALHDIGKLALPEAILNKPGPLDEEEWRFMRKHTAIGERILGAAPALSEVSRLVRASHERYDGAGYPDGLAGEDIPLGARIIFVCDAFDAMTEDRPYRARRTPEEALAELRRHAGGQFDAAVVKAFVTACREQAGELALQHAA